MEPSIITLAVLLSAAQWRTVALTGDRMEGHSAGPNGTIAVGGAGKVCYSSDDPPQAYCDRGNGLAPVLRPDWTLPMEPVYAVSRIGDGIAYDDAVSIDEDGDIAYVVNGEMLLMVIDDRISATSSAGGFLQIIGQPRVAHGHVAFMTSDGMQVAIYRTGESGLKLIGTSVPTYEQLQYGITVDFNLGHAVGGNRLNAWVETPPDPTSNYASRPRQGLIREGQLLAAYGDTVPGTDSEFERFFATAVDDDTGDVAFTARLVRGKRSGQVGLFVAQEGRIDTLAIAGDKIEVRPGDVRVVDEVILIDEVPNRGAQTMTKGELGFSIAFTDKTMGAFVVELH